MEKAPSIGEARAALDELTRQLVLERRYAVLARRRGERPPELPADARAALAGFEARSCTFPELEPLLDACDRVLVLSDGVVLEVALLTLVLDGRAASSRLALERLGELGGWLTQPATGAARAPVAIGFHLFEVHPGPPSHEWRAQARTYRRRGLARPRVGIDLTALDASTGRPFCNAAGFSRLSLALLSYRAWRERHDEDEKRKRRLARSGFQPVQALLAGAGGALLGAGALSLLLSEFVTKGDAYAGTVAISCALAALAGVKSCRICRRTVAQAMAAGLTALAGNLVAWWKLRLPLTPALGILAAFVALACFAVGALSGPRR